MTVRLLGEICCEMCNSIIHNHIDECANCDSNRPGTDAYAEVSEGDIIECESCSQKYEVVRPATPRSHGAVEEVESQ